MTPEDPARAYREAAEENRRRFAALTPEQRWRWLIETFDWYQRLRLAQDKQRIELEKERQTSPDAEVSPRDGDSPEGSR